MQRAGWLTSCAFLIASAIGVARADGVRAGSEAPDFVLKSVDGANLRLSEHRGEIVLVAFWASWCGDCRAQLEELRSLHDVYGDAGFKLLAVSLDRDRHRAKQGAHAMNAVYAVLHDAGGEIGRLYQVDSMPMAVLVDRQGIVREVFHGHRRGRDEGYLEHVRALLRE